MKAKREQDMHNGRIKNLERQAEEALKQGNEKLARRALQLQVEARATAERAVAPTKLRRRARNVARGKLKVEEERIQGKIRQLGELKAIHAMNDAQRKMQSITDEYNIDGAMNVFDKTAGSIQEQADKLSAMDTIAVSEGEDLDRQLAAISQKTRSTPRSTPLKARLAEGGTSSAAPASRKRRSPRLRGEVGRRRRSAYANTARGRPPLGERHVCARAAVNRQAAASGRCCGPSTRARRRLRARLCRRRRDHIHGTGVLSGRGAIEAHETSLLREFPGTQLAFYDFWQDGLAVVVHYGVNGRTPAGQAMGHEGLLFYRFDPPAWSRRSADTSTARPPWPSSASWVRRPRARGPRCPARCRPYQGTSPREGANAALVRPPSPPWMRGTKRDSSPASRGRRPRRPRETSPSPARRT